MQAQDSKRNQARVCGVQTVIRVTTCVCMVRGT
jgi:hypothetical protein